MSRKDDKPKNHSYDVENIEDNFAISVLSLVLTATLVLLCVGYFSLLFPENGKLPGGLFGLFAGLAVYFVCFILSLITTVTSLIGFLLGHSSIKGFETKRKRMWAIIVTTVNFVALIGSIVGVIHFSWIFR
jgi:hypothetical protein